MQIGLLGLSGFSNSKVNEAVKWGGNPTNPAESQCDRKKCDNR